MADSDTLTTTDKSTETNKGGDLRKAMKQNFTYPSPSDPDFQEKIYQKREFYYHKMPARPALTNYNDIKEYRDNICARSFALLEHQSFLANFINPDTPYRGVVVFHGTGTGKCLAPNQRVLLNGEYVPIQQIWKKYSTEIVPDEVEGEWSLPSKKLTVQTLDQDTGKLIEGQVVHLYRQKVDENLRKITLASGKTITVTQKHPLLKDHLWTNQIEVGDFIGVPTQITLPETQKDLDLAYFMAWQIAEGHERANQSGLYITNKDLTVLNRLQQVFLKLGTKYQFECNHPDIKYPKDRVPYLQVYSQEYVEFLEKQLSYTWGNLSAKKVLPKFVMQGTVEVKKTFLRSFFDAEGSVEVKNATLEISSASPQIMYQLQTLLLSLGINLRIKDKKSCATNGKKIMRDYQVGYIRSEDLRRFHQLVGLETDYKAEKMGEICQKKANSNVVNFRLAELFQKMKQEHQLPNEVFVFHQYISGSRAIGKENLRKVIQNLKDILEDSYPLSRVNRLRLHVQKETLQQQIQFLETVELGLVNYEKIVSIEPVRHQGYVFDLEVLKHHNYIAEHVLNHNTCAGISIAMRHLTQMVKYNTKIHVLVSGPLIKENWKRDLLKCTGETFLKYQDKNTYVDEQERNKQIKNAMNQALQYFRFMSYRSFYKKVLGEKIVEKKMTKDNKVKVSYRKTDEGDFERDLAVDRIYNLNNSLIVVDEAHNLTTNSYGEALMKIIKNSTNLRVVLLTATPMKNLADDIIELLNFVRPPDAPIMRDRIFNSYKNHQMDFKPGGIEYLKNMSRGYISYLRGADPMTFAKRIEKGVRPKGLIFTLVTPCLMLPFQRALYDETIKDMDDTLDRRSEAVANFVFPGLTSDRKGIRGYAGREGLNIIMNQLKTHHEALNKRIATDLLADFDTEAEGDLLTLSETNKTVTGAIFKSKYLKLFSTKFYRALKKLRRLFFGKKGSRTAFVYSNLVKVGIELFQEILMQNGYLEYQENANNYTISHDTICYYCGNTYKEHQQRQLIEQAHQSRAKGKRIDDSESSTEYKPTKDKMPEHQFYPATFISVTGKTSEESAEVIPEDKKRILDDVFNHIENKEGKYIKLVLGSKVMNEGISLMNVAEVHILDVYFNLGKVDQVIGRGIRHCSHYNITNDNNRFPFVNVYKYAVTTPGAGLSTEEELYRKAEKKYLLIKKVERVLKQNAVDCPLNRNGNMFAEEIEKFKKCGQTGQPQCPGVCDYMQCDFVCEGKTLNAKYYDPHNTLYRKIARSQLDYSTFTHSLAQNEIEYAKKQIKNMYRTKYVFTLQNVIDYVKNSYSKEKRELFDNFFVYKALDELIPVTENDFNNFRDTILDKFSHPGYLIYIDSFYIFQPFDQNEDVPMYYRTTFDKPVLNQLSLYNYLKNTKVYQKHKDKSSKKKDKARDSNLFKEDYAFYDFESVMEYYDQRDEYKYVGIVDKEASRRKVKRPEEMMDVFKIREKRSKILEKKRGTGIPSIKGAVCATSKSKDYLDGIAKELGVKLKGEETRIEVCNFIRDRLIHREKYSTGKDKKTYVMIPKNHATFPFPLNLEDRLQHIKNQIKNKIKFKLEMQSKTLKQSSGPDKGMPYYQLRIKQQKALDDFAKFLGELGGKLEGKEWVITLN